MRDFILLEVVDDCDCDGCGCVFGFILAIIAAALWTALDLLALDGNGWYSIDFWYVMAHFGKCFLVSLIFALCTRRGGSDEDWIFILIAIFVEVIASVLSSLLTYPVHGGFDSMSEVLCFWAENWWLIFVYIAATTAGIKLGHLGS